jgi:hypothetical protein
MGRSKWKEAVRMNSDVRGFDCGLKEDVSRAAERLVSAFEGFELIALKIELEQDGRGEWLAGKDGIKADHRDPNRIELVDIREARPLIRIKR